MMTPDGAWLVEPHRSAHNRDSWWFRAVNPERDKVISDLSIAGRRAPACRARLMPWGDLVEYREPAAETGDPAAESA
jgi:hypothetical protein